MWKFLDRGRCYGTRINYEGSPRTQRASRDGARYPNLKWTNMVLWQSSTRPMYVRTVWVDGFRHAILSQDDPYFQKLKRRRPHSSASSCATKNTSSRLSHHKNEVEVCLRKLNLVVKSRKSHITKRPKSSNEPDIERLNLTDVDDDSEQELVLKATPQPMNESGRYDFYTMRNSRINKTARTDVKENTELSDRVLQWLDLAGKVDLLAPQNAERMSQPRHSWPELQRRHNLLKSKTAIDVRKEGTKLQSPKPGDSPKEQQNVNIDRQEFYVPTSANTIENYARQSRNVKITPRVETQSKTREYTGKTKPTLVRASVQETRQKVATERNAVEKQYAEMVSKKLIPDVSKTTKKQVHIFMPEMPKKSPASVMSTTSRTESILSMNLHKIISK